MIYDLSKLQTFYIITGKIKLVNFGGLKKQLGGNAIELDYKVASKAFAKYIFANLWYN